MHPSVLDVPADLHGPSLARQFTKAYCLAHQLDESTTDTAVLLVSELVTNAVIHGRGAVRLELASRSGRALYAEVEDDQVSAPVVGDLATDRQHGRGLAIVAACARQWGVRHVDTGKLVWFEL